MLKLADGTYIELLQTGTDAQLSTAQPMIGFEVDDLAKSIAILKQRNVKLIDEVEYQQAFLWQLFQGVNNIQYRLIQRNKQL